jgi:rfaE bifunctional protein nucleotidyltransferase chain/domain
MQCISTNIIEPNTALSLGEDVKKIFISGVFDVLHLGHINFLRQAKAVVGHRGKLIVAVHDDDSVKKHKGKDRPINVLEHRMEFLAELKTVDLLLPWHGWEDIQGFVQELKPQHIAVTKGQFENKTLDQVAKSIGSKVHVFDNMLRLSTSSILNKLTEL